MKNSKNLLALSLLLSVPSIGFASHDATYANMVQRYMGSLQSGLVYGWGQLPAASSVIQSVKDGAHSVCVNALPTIKSAYDSMPSASTALQVAKSRISSAYHSMPSAQEAISGMSQAAIASYEKTVEGSQALVRMIEKNPKTSAAVALGTMGLVSALSYWRYSAKPKAEVVMTYNEVVMTYNDYIEQATSLEIEIAILEELIEGLVLPINESKLAELRQELKQKQNELKIANENTVSAYSKEIHVENNQQ